MRVDIQRHIDNGFDGGNKLFGHFRRQYAGHILNADRVRTHHGQLLCQIGVKWDRVDVADGVTDRQLRMGAVFFDGFK